MSQAALLSGLALANSGLGLAHGVAAGAGRIHCRVPHGYLACCRCHAADRIKSELADVREKANWASLSLLCLTRTHASPDADAFVRRIESLCRDIGIPSRLKDLGVTRNQIPALVSGSKGNSMSGNPRDVGDEELRQILERMRGNPFAREGILLSREIRDVARWQRRRAPCYNSVIFVNLSFRPPR